jgi:psp operon transcriptional activator
MEQHSRTDGLPEAIGRSEAFLLFQERISAVAPVDRPVLIIGERGTGKELAATRLHYLSRRWQEPLMTLNCAALAPSLLESELFGHEPGAFTGATGRRVGRFEAADGGTLFLDEIGNMPLQVQEKILRVIEYGSFERVGGSAVTRVDVRIIAATHADLPAMASRGTFMKDLLDRLSFEVIRVPPLRERGEDILQLAAHFAARMAVELGREAAPRFSEGVVAALLRYPWPGNVRECKNVIERAVYRCGGDTVEEVEFDPFAAAGVTSSAGDGASYTRSADRSAGDGASFTHPPDLSVPLSEAVHALKRAYLICALEKSRHNQRRAARILGLTYHQFRALYRGMKDELAG